MDNYILPVQVRWSDLDPNFHVRHSIFYDWGAMCRIEFLNTLGLGWKKFAQLQIGPIIFREECIFRKEIRPDDAVTIDLKLLKARKDFSRFTIQHEIKKEPNITSAILTVDIAWLHGATRKLAVLPAEEIKILEASPVVQNFQWEL